MTSQNIYFNLSFARLKALASQNRGGVRRQWARNHYFDKNFAYFFSIEKV